MKGNALSFCGWCGIAAIFVTAIGLGPIAHLSPPPSPMISAGEVAAFFRQDATPILVGAFCVNVAVALSIALTAGISAVIRRMEGSFAPVLSYLQLGAGTAASLFVMLPAMIWNVAVFRADLLPTCS